MLQIHIYLQFQDSMDGHGQLTNGRIFSLSMLAFPVVSCYQHPSWPIFHLVVVAYLMFLLFLRISKMGLNAYLYAPKDDSKHRMYWRELYSVEEAGM